ncbi:Calcium load-activated calcium channel [Zea mays]|uniref:Calcium load-activated calcium channel n=2 Tax=Zea mays TaxID=4577 RepID=A0A3L6FUD9_MAIZE|nr:Calcium load-activated calcium channel [Zea mays]PWZ38498.1 Calcium load-activated calcium channel [Zea mays]
MGHRRLLGNDPIDCSMIFRYFLSSMTIRTNLQKLLDFAPPAPFPRVEPSWCSSTGPEQTSSPAGGTLAASTKAGSRLASPRASLSAGATVAAPTSFSPCWSLLPGVGRMGG